MESNIKLSREELLAGKCFPSSMEEPADPRFKSPDAMLLELARRHENNGFNIHPDPVAEPYIEPSSDCSSAQETKITVNSFEIKFTQQTVTIDRIEQLRQYYESELQRWRDYSNKVQEWFKEVTKLVANANNHLALTHNISNENELLRRELKLREQEVEDLKQKIAPSKKPDPKPQHVFSIHDII